MANPLENMLLLQYLSGAGQDIGSGNAIGTNVNAITQQNIQSRNFMKLIQKMLGGEVPEGGKITTDPKGTKIEIPKTASQVNMSPNAQDPTTQARAGSLVSSSPSGGSADLMQLLSMGSLLNPSASPLDISGADLAGLTPQDISQALRLKLGQEELSQRKMSDLVDMVYKSALTQKTLTPKDTRTPAMKNYEYYTNQQRALGKSPESFEKWDKDTRTGYQKDFEEAKASGYEGTFWQWYQDIHALTGGLPIDEYRKRKEVNVDVDAKAAVTDPGLVAKILKDLPTEVVYFDHKDQVDEIVKKYQVSTDVASEIVRKALVRQELDNRIKQAYRDQKVTFKKGDGWYVGSKLIRKDPYGTK